jgi:hypothetical protein
MRGEARCRMNSNGTKPNVTFSFLHSFKNIKSRLRIIHRPRTMGVPCPRQRTIPTPGRDCPSLRWSWSCTNEQHEQVAGERHSFAVLLDWRQTQSVVGYLLPACGPALCRGGNAR